MSVSIKCQERASVSRKNNERQYQVSSKKK